MITLGGWKKTWKRFRRNRLAVLSLVLLLFVHAAAVCAPVLTRYSPEDMNLLKPLASPDRENFLGTDESGRDVYTRLLFGARVSLGVGIMSMLVSISLGVFLGAAAGYFGGAVDGIIMRIADGMLSIPTFFLAIIVLAVLGASTLNVVAVIGLTQWMTASRVVRGEVLKTKTTEFVEAARALGAKEWRIIARHVLPHAGPSVIVAATLNVAHAVTTETSLSYLGLGIQPPLPSWGNMLMGAQGYLWTCPHLAVYPGLLIFFTVMAFNSVGDGLRDALDPTMVART